MSSFNLLLSVLEGNFIFISLNISKSKFYNFSFFNTRLIAGTEINSFEGLTITALAKNRQGWANLCRLLT